MSADDAGRPTFVSKRQRKAAQKQGDTANSDTAVGGSRAKTAGASSDGLLDSWTQSWRRGTGEATGFVEAEPPHIDDLRGLIIGYANRPVLREIAKQCRQDERPVFILGDLISGALSAFEDRCLIVKKGVMTSLVSGSLGGGRVTTFMYSQMTGIEFNVGLTQGVIEVLTPSYQGTANKDFWRGAMRSPNGDHNNPQVLSNTLPVDKKVLESGREQLKWLQGRVAAAHGDGIAAAIAPLLAQPSVESEAPRSLTAELAQLAELHSAGALSDDEFAAAKRSLLGS